MSINHPWSMAIIHVSTTERRRQVKARRIALIEKCSCEWLDYHRSQSNSKRNASSFPVDESYHLYQLYQQQMQQADHRQKSPSLQSFDESNRPKDHFNKPTSMTAAAHYPMNLNSGHPSAAPYAQHSHTNVQLPPLDLNGSSQSSLAFEQDAPAMFLARSHSCQAKTSPCRMSDIVRGSSTHCFVL